MSCTLHLTGWTTGNPSLPSKRVRPPRPFGRGVNVFAKPLITERRLLDRGHSLKREMRYSPEHKHRPPYIQSIQLTPKHSICVSSLCSSRPNILAIFKRLVDILSPFSRSLALSRGRVLLQTNSNLRRLVHLGTFLTAVYLVQQTILAIVNVDFANKI